MTLNEMLEQYRDMKDELQPSIDALSALNKAIRDHVLTTGELGAVEGLATKIRRGYTRRTWNSDKLLGYSTSHPEILVFCKETEVSESVTLVKHTMPEDSVEDEQQSGYNDTVAKGLEGKGRVDR